MSMTPAAEIVEYQLEVAHRWLDEATALADRPAVEFIAQFSAFNAVYWLWAALNPEQSFSQVERNAVKTALAGIDEQLRERVIQKLKGGTSEGKMIAAVVQRLGPDAAAGVLHESADFITYLRAERQRPIHRMDKRSAKDSVGDPREGQRHLRVLGEEAASSIDKVKAVAGALYLIRCNLVHGSKVMHVEREEHVLVRRALPALRSLTRAVVEHCERNRPA
jgi:hypothetical protein